MLEQFEDALGRIIDEFLERGTSRDNIISALELRKMALEEEDDE